MERTFDDHFAYEVHKKISVELGSDLIKFIFEPSQCHVITKNLFQYKGFVRILWIHPKYEKWYTDERIKLILGEDCVFFISSEDRRSIKNIKHIHF